MKARILFFLAMSILVTSCGWFGGGDEDPEPKSSLTSVTGIVQDQNGSSLANVKVFYKYKSDTSPRDNSKTDSNGNYSFDSMESGECSFTFEKEGYETQTIDIDIKIDIDPNTKKPKPKYLIVTMKELSGALKASPDHLEFNTGENQKTVLIENSQKQGNINISISVTKESESWLKIDKTSGTVSNANAFQLTASVVRNGLGFGNYLGSILVNYGTGNVKIPVNLNISNPDAPSVSISKGSVSQTSAEFLGTVLAEGGSRVIERGHVWSESENPTLESNIGVTKKGPGGLGSFSSLISNLTPGKTYYIRAYATNANGTKYSTVEKFTTLIDASKPTIGVNNITEITGTSASVFGIATSDGGKPITEMGIVYDVGTTPTLTDSKKTVAVNVGTEFKIPLTGLTAGVTYFVRAFATNSVGTEYSAARSFTTESNFTPASLVTGGGTDVGETKATLNATINLGGSPVVQHGFVWSTKISLPTISNATKKELGPKTDNQPISYTATTLSKGTLYYVRAFATSQDGKTVYGNTKEVVTKEAGLLVYYTFNNDIGDKSGYGNNATTTARYDEDQYGNNSYALDLNTGSTNIENEKIGRFVGSFTISLWFKNNSSLFSGSNKIMFSKAYERGCTDHRYWGGYYVYFDAQSKSIKLNVRGYKGTTNTIYSTDLKLLEESELKSNNNWYNLIIVKEGLKVKTYINGQPASENETEIFSYGSAFGYISNTTIEYEGRLFFGRLGNGLCDFGMPNLIIDDFRLYNYSLTPDEVKNVYNR